MTGAGFRFDAPRGWKVSGSSASHDSELVQVAAFKLVRPYTNALFDRVAVELATRMKTVAAQTGGKITRRSTVTVAGIRAHAYDVTAGDHVDEYTFVLRGHREFQLLCRRRSSSSGDFCSRLVTSFEPA